MGRGGTDLDGSELVRCRKKRYKVGLVTRGWDWAIVEFLRPGLRAGFGRQHSVVRCVERRQYLI